MNALIIRQLRYYILYFLLLNEQTAQYDSPFTQNLLFLMYDIYKLTA